MRALVWLERAGGPGALQAATQAGLPVADRGFWFGDGLFESTVVCAGTAPLLRRHLRRLGDGLTALGFGDLPWTEAELAQRCGDVIAANGVGDGWLRLAVSRGEGPRGFLPPAAGRPLLLIQAGAAAGPDAAAGAAAPGLHAVAGAGFPGLHAGWAPWRVDPAFPGCRLKSLSALDKVLARQEAARRGLDELLLCNTAGEVTEGTASNLFILRDGALLTPDAACGLLPGIARTLVLELAAAAGYRAAEARLRPDDLAAAAEAFLTNAVRGVVPLLSIEGRTLGGQAGVGPHTRRLQALYQEHLKSLL